MAQLWQPRAAAQGPTHAIVCEKRWVNVGQCRHRAIMHCSASPAAPQLALRNPPRVGVAEVVAQSVGAVAVLTEMLELEAQHQSAVRPDIEGRVLDEGLDVARGQHEAFV